MSTTRRQLFPEQQPRDQASFEAEAMHSLLDDSQVSDSVTESQMTSDSQNTSQDVILAADSQLSTNTASDDSVTKDPTASDDVEVSTVVESSQSPDIVTRDAATDAKDVPEAVEVPVEPKERAIEHDEFCARAVNNSKSHSSIRRTHAPQLWRHERIPRGSLCLYGAIDDGVRIAKTGVKWMLDTKMYVSCMHVAC